MWILEKRDNVQMHRCSSAYARERKGSGVMISMSWVPDQDTLAYFLRQEAQTITEETVALTRK
jgi:hypothetical protein